MSEKVLLGKTKAIEDGLRAKGVRLEDVDEEHFAFDDPQTPGEPPTAMTVTFRKSGRNIHSATVTTAS